MKRLNKKGFSLVELLAAIAILAILMTVATQAYNSYKKQARQQAYDTMAESATTAATNYLMENTKAKYITFDTLKDMQYIDTLQDPRYKDKECSGIVINKVMPGDTQKQLDVLFQKVKLCCKNYKYQYDYTGDEVTVTEIDSCEYVDGDEIAGVYKLIYKTQGGTECDPAVVKKTQFEEWGPLCETSKTNFVFHGWNTKKNGSGSTITEHTKVGDKDINAYAIWNAIYTLTYDEDGGTACNPKTISRENGEKWGILCESTKSGYAFKGWRTEKNGAGSKINSDTTVSKTLTVYAHWNPYYILTLDYNGGNTCNPKTITKEKGEEWGALCTPIRSGYVFKGWNTKKDGTGTKVTASTKVTSNMTVYAIWNPLYTLTFDSNGGSTCNPKTITKENGVEWGKLCVPTREGYTFVEWKDSNGNSVKNTTKASKTFTATAVWRQNCPNGYTYQSGDGTCKKVYNATEKYKCNSGDALSGTTCTNTSTYAATVSYTCPNGGNLSGTSCVTQTTTSASLSYECKSGDTLSGSTCIGSSTYTATSTKSYTNCDWVTDGGHFKSSKPSGVIYRADRPSCNSSNRGITRKVYNCNPGKACLYKSGSYNCKSPCGGIKTGYGYKIHTCECDETTTYTCPNGGTRSGTICYVDEEYAATEVYTCPSGTVKSGTTCISTSSYNATTNYNCNSGDVLGGKNCTKTTTYVATKYYVCNNGDTLSGTTCTSIVTP